MGQKIVETYDGGKLVATSTIDVPDPEPTLEERLHDLELRHGDGATDGALRNAIAEARSSAANANSTAKVSAALVQLIDALMGTTTGVTVPGKPRD